jgi:hypothetical protein
MGEKSDEKKAWTGFAHGPGWTGFYGQSGPAADPMDRLPEIKSERVSRSNKQDSVAPRPGLKCGRRKMGRPPSREKTIAYLRIFSQNVRLLHQTSRLILKQVAESSGTSAATVQRMRAGTHLTEEELRDAIIQVYCSAIGCDLASFDLFHLELTPELIREARRGRK